MDQPSMTAKVRAMLEDAPCPVSARLIAHHVDAGGLPPADVFAAVRAALEALRAEGTATFVDRTKMAKRWPPEAFSDCQEGAGDAAKQLALGAWAAKDNEAVFDHVVKHAHLPKQRRYAYGDAWWGVKGLEGDALERASADANSHMGPYGLAGGVYFGAPG